jgi:hypothetical protein
MALNLCSIFLVLLWFGSCFYTNPTLLIISYNHVQNALLAYLIVLCSSGSKHILICILDTVFWSLYWWMLGDAFQYLSSHTIF